jgi:hypothetical protein
MAGPGSITSIRTSVYHTAAESDSSPANSRSPIGFWTPAPPRLDTVKEDDDETPRAMAFQRALNEKDVGASTASAALLERYVGGSTPAATPTHNTPRTRLQARLQASQESQTPSTASTRIPTSSKIRSRQLRTESTPTTTTSSPLVRKNMVLDVSPHSTTYSAQVKDVVEHVVQSLTRRGRLMEGHALNELYKQSFKDPGTAELLDALLRQRANERQKRDFVRYVEHVTRLGQETELLVQQDQQHLDHNIELEPQENMEIDINEEEVAYLVPEGTILPPSPRVVIEVPFHPQSRSNVPVQEEGAELTKSFLDVEGLPISTSLLQQINPDSQAKDDLTPTSSTISALENLSRDAAQQSQSSEVSDPMDAPSRHSSPVAAQTVSSNKWERIAPRSKMPVLVNKSHAKPRSVVPVVDIIQFAKHKTSTRRRKKNRRRMFSAANGPVFSKSFKMP